MKVINKVVDKIKIDENNNDKIRNYGIDALRILAMFFIVCHHVLLHGGVLDNVVFGTIKYNLFNILNVLLLCAVNCYGLISGYVGVNKKVKYTNLICLWLQVVCYCVCGYIVFKTIIRADIPFNPIKVMFMPILTGQYWYFIAYFFMFLGMPFYNKLLNSLDKNGLKYLGITLIFSMSILSIFTNQTYLNYGFSWTWLSVLYLLGGIVKKLDYGKNIKVRWCLLGILLCVIIGFESKVIGVLLSYTSLKDGILTKYSSPVMLCMGMLFLIMFKNIKFKHQELIKIVEFISPLTFGIYLIHENQILKAFWLKNSFAEITINSSPLRLLEIVISNVLFIFIVCGIIEFVRLKIFNALHIKEKIYGLEKRIEAKIELKENVREQKQ